MNLLSKMNKILSAERIFISLFQGMVIGGIIFMILYFFFWRKMKTKKKIIYFFLYIYFGALFSLTLPIVLPAGWHISKFSFENALNAINLVPLKLSIPIYRNSIMIGQPRPFYYLIGGNLVMLMPFAMALTSLHPKWKVRQVVFLSFLLSFCIELFQFIANVLSGYIIRSVDIDDLLLNTIGTFGVAVLFAAIRKMIKRIRKKKKKR